MENLEQKKGGNQPRKHAIKLHSVSKLRRMRLIEAALDGKPLRKVGLEMGLSPKTVDSQVSRIMREPQVRLAFNQILEEAGITDKFLADKIKALTCAETNTYAQVGGKFTDSRSQPAHETIRKTVELCCRLNGYLKEQDNTTINNAGLLQIVVAQLNQSKH